MQHLLLILKRVVMLALLEMVLLRCAVISLYCNKTATLSKARQAFFLTPEVMYGLIQKTIST